MRSQLWQNYQLCRQRTLDLLTQLYSYAGREIFSQQIHPDFSPIGWHWGHIIYTQELWILRKTAGQNSISDQQIDRLFSADGLPKVERQNLPSWDWIMAYGDLVNERLFNYLYSLSLHELQTQERLWRWLLQHEVQHQETISFLMQIAGIDLIPKGNSAKQENTNASLPVPAGEVVIGCDSVDALDNEQKPHIVYLPAFVIDALPVSCQEYAEFMAMGGYFKPEYWSEAGWAWVRSHQIDQPLYWRYLAGSSNPVCGISWYEASAYVNFAGKALPSEWQWEKAVRYYPEYQEQFVGQVWQWTSSLFTPYPNFTPYPYPGYSSAYFDNQHYVLRGGSWLTAQWSLRPTFRNWYLPHTRQIFAGLRCVHQN
jgi:ergothioneine biosynthesis protein EgtB